MPNHKGYKHKNQLCDAATKTCHECGRELPNTTEFFYARTSRASLSHMCIECSREQKKKAWAEKKATGVKLTLIGRPKPRQSPDAPTKHCYTCQRTLPNTTDFFRTMKGRYSLSAMCIECDRKKKAAYYATNKERINAALRAKRQEDKEFAESDRSRGREWYEKKGKKLRSGRRYRSKHSEQIRLKDHRRRAILAGADGSHSALDIKKQRLKQRGRCFYCDASLGLSEHHVDHVTPLSRGGSNGAENLVIACPTCNLKKGARTFDEFVRYMHGIISNNGVSKL